MQINKTGIWGEIYAARYLRDNGYKIISANFRSKLGEIDIIAQKGKYMCFVEVKTRGENPLYEPKEAVDYHKQKRITATAQIFNSTYPHKKQPRFDVCEIILDEQYKVKNINYIKNAF